MNDETSPLMALLFAIGFVGLVAVVPLYVWLSGWLHDLKGRRRDRRSRRR